MIRCRDRMIRVLFPKRCLGSDRFSILLVRLTQFSPVLHSIQKPVIWFAVQNILLVSAPKSILGWNGLNCWNVWIDKEFIATYNCNFLLICFIFSLNLLANVFITKLLLLWALYDSCHLTCYSHLYSDWLPALTHCEKCRNFT